MNRLERESYLTNEAIGLTNGETTQRIACPSCSQAGSFSLTREPDRILYICHRASCGVAGTIRVGLQRTESASESFRPPKPSPWQAELEERTSDLPEPVLNHLFTYYDIKQDSVEAVEMEWLPLFSTSQFNGRLWVPYYNEEGDECGGTARSLERDTPKNISVKHRRNPNGMSWYSADFNFGFNVGPVVIVEDPFSAIRLAQKSVTALALNGTSLTEDRVLEIKRVAEEDIVLALDGDAIQLALKYSFKYSSVLYMDVRYLPKDVKDMNVAAFNTFLKSLPS